jgi:predicted restriction endonuclease
MNKRTKALQFDKPTKLKIFSRDDGCIFCKMYYHMDPKVTLAYMIHDPMHVINKSQGGLGVVQNGVDGCRYHHSLMDNGNKGLREEMIRILKDYLTSIYPDWTEESVTYNKWNNFK